MHYNILQKTKKLILISIYILLFSCVYSQGTIPPHDTTWYDPFTEFTYYLNNGQQTHYSFIGSDGIIQVHPMNSGKTGITKVDSIAPNEFTLESILDNATRKRINAFDNKDYNESLKYNETEIMTLKNVIKSDSNTKYMSRLIDAMIGIGNTYLAMGNEKEAIINLQYITEFEDKMFPIYPTGVINIYSKITNAYYALAQKLPKDSPEQKRTFMDCAKYGYEVPSEKFGSKWLGSMTKEQEGYLNKISSAYYLTQNIVNRLKVLETLISLFPNDSDYKKSYKRISK